MYFKLNKIRACTVVKSDSFNIECFHKDFSCSMQYFRPRKKERRERGREGVNGKRWEEEGKEGG